MDDAGRMPIKPVDPAAPKRQVPPPELGGPPVPALPAAPPPAANTPGRVVQTRLAACHVPGVGDEVLCGRREVWEDRARARGRKVQLEVLVLPASGPAPAADPVFFLGGGEPGETAAKAAAFHAILFGPVRRDRDVVFVENRAGGEGIPPECRQPGGRSDLQGHLQELYPTETVRACAAALKRTGSDPRFVTDEILADDLDEVREWLGYARINLFATAAGTRTAQVFMRRHPGRMRSALLEGFLPVDARVPLFDARQAQAALDRLFEDCAADAECHAAFPDPQGELRTALAHFDKGPVTRTLPDPMTGKPVALTLSRSAFAGLIRTLQMTPTGCRFLPLYLHRAALDDWRPFLYAGISPVNDDAWSLALPLSLSCAEDQPRIAALSPAETQAAERADTATYLGDDRLRRLRAACAVWPAAKLPPAFWETSPSQVPVLFLSGRLDPTSSPGWLAEATRLFPNSLTIALHDGSRYPTGLTHLVDCLYTTIADFFVKGTTAGLETSCTREIQRPPFMLRYRVSPRSRAE